MGYDILKIMVFPYIFYVRGQQMTPDIKTHDSESQHQEETVIIRETKITQPLSELFTRKITNKIANALAKLP